MSGSLARLVLLAQGQLPVAEPLLPSRFAPAGPAPAATDPLATEAVWSEPAAEPATAPPEGERLPDPETPAPSRPQRAPASQDATETGAESIASLWSLSRTGPALPPRAPPLPPAAPLNIEASAGVSPERAQARPPTVPAHPMVAAAPLAQAEKPELTARIAASLHRPRAPDAQAEKPELTARNAASLRRPRAPDVQAEAESLRPAPHSLRLGPAAFVPSPIEITHAARATTPFGAGLPAMARAPDVQISIGRVEVHARPALAAAVPVALARRPPLSLADYLARRK
jgi:hypothetical protein